MLCAGWPKKIIINLFFAGKSHHKSSSSSSSSAAGGGNNANKEPHIKKPLNAFMLYMKEMRPVVQVWHTHCIDT